MNPQDRLQQLKDASAVRSKRYYESKKAVINERRRLAYASKKVKPVPIPVEPATVPRQQAPQVAELIQKFNKYQVKPIPVKPTTVQPINQTELLIQKLTDLGLTHFTLQKYIQDLKRLLLITQSEDIIKDLTNKPDLIIQQIKNFKKNGKPYSSNTQKALFQFILVLAEKLKLPFNKQPYNQQFEISKIKSSDQNITNKTGKQIITFKEYLEDIKEQLGENSKMYLLVSMYNELTIRDDFVLKIIETESQATDEKTNYIILKQSKSVKMTASVIINHYKTSKKYGQIKHTFSPKVSKLIYKYVKDNKLKNGDFLFGPNKLTSYIASTNTKLGLNIGISTMRSMKITEELKQATPEKRVELASQMKHSPVVQLSYVNKHKND